jgi:hypothetical protein
MGNRPFTNEAARAAQGIAPGAHPRALAAALLWPLLVALVCESACLETRLSVGEECLNNDECLSGICSQLHCAVPPPTVDARIILPDADGDATTDGPTETTGSEAGSDVAVEAASETSAESSVDVDLDSAGPGD